MYLLFDKNERGTNNPPTSPPPPSPKAKCAFGEGAKPFDCAKNTPFREKYNGQSSSGGMLDAIEVVVEGVGGGDIVFEGHALVVFQHFGQAPDLDTGEGDLVMKFAFDIYVQADHFGFGEVLGVEAVTEGVTIARLSAAVARVGGRVRHRNSRVNSRIDE